MDLPSLLAVGCGAFLGAVLRWMLGLWLNPLFPTLPLGTLGANLLGGLLMGMAIGVLSQFDALSPAARLFFTTGFLGGLTTFSTFSAETVTLMLRQQYAWTLAIVGAHVAGTLAMTLAGIALVRAVGGAR
ncbi:fluoride efflux transporter CrcB [Dyella sp.]|uniref:fluoride efflux transporter CrcB n=1 Tax=Dyella sp. TaxID=1869338 RepID=UPI0039C884EC